MNLIPTPSDLNKYYEIKTRSFEKAQMMGVMFNIKEEIARKLLPPPLELTDSASGLIFIAQYQDTNLGSGYKEAGLFLTCKYLGEIGTYCLSMPINNEARMHNGRDIFGFPKKMANIEFIKSENSVYASVERNGIKFLELDIKLNTTLPEFPATGPTFLFKGMPKADLTPGFDGPVFLVRQFTEIKVNKLELGIGKIKLSASKTDPWHEIDIINPNGVMGFYLNSNNTMLPGKILAEVNQEAFLPHYFKMTDFYKSEEAM